MMFSGDKRNLVDKFKGKSVEAIAQELRSSAFEFHVAIENFQHDFNIGSIVRSANAFNAGAVHIIGKRHWNRRGAMATEKYLTLLHHPDTTTFLEWARSERILVVAVDNVVGSVPLSRVELPKHCVLVFGQEGPGLSEALLQSADMVVSIEQFGSTRSINVGAAAAVIMYEWARTHKLTK